MTDVRTIDARWACLMVERLKQERIPLDPILRKAGLTRRQVGNPNARIPYHKHAALLSLASEAVGDGCFGLRLTTTIEPKQVGLLGYVLLNSANLGDALANLVRYLRVVTDALEFDFEVGAREVVMVSRIVDPLVVDQRQVVEWSLGVLHRVCQFIIGREIRPEWVAFRHPEPKESPTVAKVFRAPMRFSQDQNALACERRYLDCPIEAADSELLKILEQHCRLILGERSKEEDLVFEVKQLIANMLPSGQPRIDTVAQDFGVSARTLTRRLAAEGISYKGLLDEVRRKLAFQYLKDRRISFKQIAYLLGYSEVSAFYHAFRRWSGASPLQHQLRHRPADTGRPGLRPQPRPRSRGAGRMKSAS